MGQDYDNPLDALRAAAEACPVDDDTKAKVYYTRLKEAEARVAELEVEARNQKARADYLSDFNGRLQVEREAVRGMLANGDGLPFGCPDTYAERAGYALAALTPTKEETDGK